MRKLVAFLGFATVCAALAQRAFAAPFLPERANGATGLLVGAGLFAIAAVVGK
jgi:hypothetical protein